MGTNRRRISHMNKTTTVGNYQYPEKYSDFLKQQREAYFIGIKEGKALFAEYCNKAVVFLKKKNHWKFLEKERSNIPMEHQFTGSLEDGYGEEKLTIETADILGN